MLHVLARSVDDVAQAVESLLVGLVRYLRRELLAERLDAVSVTDE
jgi:hypothetical protein